MTAPSPAGLSPLLDQLDEALRNRGTSLYADEVYAATVPAALPQLTAAIRAVLELHARRESYGDVDCVGCRGECLYCESEHEWPCPTVAAITAALTPGTDTAGATE